MEPNHSGLGIASFIISLVAGIAIFILFAMAGVIGATAPGRINDNFSEVLGVFIIAFLLIVLIALGLGIAGLIQKDQKKLFAILGTVFSTGAILLTSVLMIIGNSPNHGAGAKSPPGQQAAGLSGAIRDNFVSSYKFSCFKRVIDRGANQTKKVSAELITGLCTCASNYVADRLSNDEVVRMESGGNEELMNKFNRVQDGGLDYCLKNV